MKLHKIIHMYNSLKPYAGYLKGMNLFIMPVEGFFFFKEMDGLQLYMRTFMRGQLAWTVAAFGFLSWNEGCSCLSDSPILNQLCLVFAISMVVTF